MGGFVPSQGLIRRVPLDHHAYCRRVPSLHTSAWPHLITIEGEKLPAKCDISSETEVYEYATNVSEGLIEAGFELMLT